MPSTTYDRFDLGMDRRKSRQTSDANRLYDLRNCYVTGGWSVRKRPGLTKVTSSPLDSDLALGIVPHNSKLQVYAKIGATVTGLPSICNANYLGGHGAATLGRILDYEIFGAYPFILVEDNTPTVRAHYLDTTYTPAAWAAGSYTAGQWVVPTVANGYRYECTTGGTTGATEPSWGVVVGGTTSEVAPGTAIWTCREYPALSGNYLTCVEKASERLYVPSASGAHEVQYCVVSDPYDWTTTSASTDAGTLPTGRHSVGSPLPQSLGLYQDRLAVVMRDGVQTWDLDPDKSLNALGEVIPNIGTIYPRSVCNVSTDLYMLSEFGFLSLSILTVTQNLSDVDVGAAVNEAVKADLASVSDARAPVSLFVRSLGQYWCALGTKVWVYTFSRASRISAWSYYTFPFSVVALAELEGAVYILGDDRHIYKLDETVYRDAGADFECVCELPYLDVKKSGQLKQFIGVDVVQQGQSQLAFRYDANNTSAITSTVTLSGDTRSGGMVGVEVSATEIAPKFSFTGNAAWELNLLTLYYEVLGVM